MIFRRAMARESCLMSLLLTPVVGLVSLQYWRVHFITLAAALCACSFQLSWALTCTPRYLKLLTSWMCWPSIVSGGCSSSIFFLSSSGSCWVFCVAWSTLTCWPQIWNYVPCSTAGHYHHLLECLGGFVEVFFYHNQYYVIDISQWAFLAFVAWNVW